VLSVSRREESLAEAPASIYVITHDEIRRSGVTTLPEALRLAPNLIVARADANQYAISARGFNNVLANKLLVMIDGRTVYTPLFSGVFWEAQIVMLEDIERIEVVSGPGATLWGANAVDGVINIITRGAERTQGFLVSGGAATPRPAWRCATAARCRTAAATACTRSTSTSTIRRSRAAARSATRRSAAGRVPCRLERAGRHVHRAGRRVPRPDRPEPGERKIDGANLVGRWSRKLADGSAVRVQAYWDYTHREHPAAVRGAPRHARRRGAVRLHRGAHEILVGGGYR
jgi:iron complex outermembrane receptor protein